MRVPIIEDDIYLPEPVGMQPKYWLCLHDNRFLFKQNTYKQDGSSVYNDVSECIASDIARLLGIPVASYYLCTHNGKNGVITPDFLDNSLEGPKKEEFYDGVFLISKIDPGFKNGSLVNPKTHQAYTVDLVLRSIEKYGLQKEIFSMLIFDALIANRDRNPSNYGIIINHEDNSVRLAPLFDNGTSLGISMVDHRLRECINNDGVIIDENKLDEVVHKHILGKVTLDRFLQYKEKAEWDEKESRRIINLINSKKVELIKLLESNKISEDDYHKSLNKIGNSYVKYNISKLEYQTLIIYLTNYYSSEIEEIINKINDNITDSNIDKIFAFYSKELPPDRIKIAKEILKRRSKWITNYYYNNYVKRGKIRND